MSTRTITADDLEDIATGGAILGTGGGGDPYIGKLMAQQAIRKYGPVSLKDIEDMPNDALIVPVCMMGAPTVMTEKLPQGDELMNAFRALEKLLGKKIDAVLCGEAGGVNSTTPFVVAAASGLPLIDGDGMGRAYPELQMVTFTMHGVSATPMVLCDDKGNSLVLDTVDNAWTERLARSATVEMGGSALLAFYAMDGATAKKAVVRGTLSLCQKLGRTLQEVRAAHGEPVAAISELLGAKTIFHGRIRDIERRTVGGFARGNARFEFCVARALGSMRTVEALQKITARLLSVATKLREAFGWKQIGYGRLFGIRLQGRPLMNGGEKACAPVDNTTGRQAALIRQHDERRQILALTAEAIGDPCTHARKTWQDVAGVGHEHRRSMQRALALHGVNKGHVINTVSELREEIADPAPALAMLTKRPVAALAVARLGGKELHLAIGIEGFAAALRQLRFVVPRVHMTEPAWAKNLNHGTCFGRQRRTPGRERIRRGLCALFQHGGKCNAAETTADFLEEVAA